MTLKIGSRNSMPASRRFIKRVLLAVTAASALTIVGCATHVAVGYRAYDPGYGDYHVWNDGEFGFYNNWIVETHHPHVDYRRLNRHEQRAYWQWRHNHH